jgi:tight adherence protein B
MDGTAGLILYLLIFVGVLLAFDGLVQLVFGGSREAEEQAVNKRLRLLSSGMDPEEVLRLLRRQRRLGAVDRIPVLRHWPPMLTQAGLTMDPMRGIYVMAGAAFAMFMVLQALGAPLLLALAVAPLLGIAVPVLLLIAKRNHRLQLLQRQLPEGIDLMVRSLRAGHPLNASIQTISRQMADPLGSEMGVVADAITYGDDLVDAMTDFADRVGIEDARYLAMAIVLQGRTGGNLAAVLDALARVIRERFAMHRKIRAISAEGRITAYVVSAAPFIIYGALNLITPSFYGDVKNDPAYPYLLGTGLVLAVLNAIWLRKLVRFHF